MNNQILYNRIIFWTIILISVIIVIILYGLSTSYQLVRQSAEATLAAAPTMTTEVLEFRYEKGLGYINTGRWLEAKMELEFIFEVDPNYKDIQSRLNEIYAKIAEQNPTSVPSLVSQETIQPKVIPVEPKVNKYVIIDESMPWTDAKIYCEKIGTHLTTITSGEEQKVVVSLLRSTGTKKIYWLGGRRESNRWHWITGEEMSYSYWAAGEPTGLSPEENFLSITAVRLVNWPVGSWNDNYNEGWNNEFVLENIGLVCERE